MEGDQNRHKPVKLIFRFLWEIITVVAPALIFSLFINVHIAEAVLIEDGPSMQPNLYIGDRLMVEKVSYHFHTPRRGDIVIVDPPGGGTTLVKRVMALPGETIELRKGYVFIQSNLVDEPWQTIYGGGDYPPTLIPEDHVFILGDNRPVSHDSRAIGPIPIDAIQGRVLFVYWPLNEFEIFP